MTTAKTVGAVSSEAAEWYAIDWQAIHQNVRRLQVRIVQATKAGRWNKVKRPSCEGWFEESGQPRSTSSRVPRQGSPSAPFRIEAASPSTRRSQGLSRMSTKVSRPVLRGPGPSNGAWLLGSEYTNARKRREGQRA